VPDGRRARQAVVTRVRVSATRVRDGVWSVLQCAVGAGLAWLLASELLDHDRPFFACVAVVVCLGVRAAQRLRRVFELAVGVTVGVAVGEALVDVIGTGAWQVALVVGLALVLALALDGGTLVTAQAGLQAVFVVALPQVPGGDLARWEDAIVGGATALLVAALLPADPWRVARRTGTALLQELAAVLRECAAAIRTDDAAAAAFALTRARATQVRIDGWTEALRTGHEITQLTPLRRDGGTWDEQSRLASGVDRATRNLRVLVRRVLFALGNGDALPPRLPAVLEELAQAVDVLVTGDLPRARAALTELAARLGPDDDLVPGGLSSSVVVGQLRSAVVDLLEGLGVEPAAARAALPPGG
jgi:uncharacterized membrane protein YgaE (UPF0421/DUF939 family)